MGTEWALASDERTRLRLVSNADDPIGCLLDPDQTSEYGLGLILHRSFEENF